MRIWISGPNRLPPWHGFPPVLLRQDVFETFLEGRRHQLTELLEHASGKPVTLIAKDDEGNGEGG